MTVFVPLDPATQTPAQPAFLHQSNNVPAHTTKALQAIMKAKRIVVICGAGISVQAGIPDFRSSEGLFQTIKRDNPKEAMSSGKELFDASVFNSENKTSLFCQMIAQLSDLSQSAQPTAFHHLLRALDNRGRLLRVYTQNIDAIEQKCGLSFGVPEFEARKSKSKGKGRAKMLAGDGSGSSPPLASGTDSDGSLGQSSKPETSTSRLPSPPVELPRCIPLHGTLQSMHCQVCNNSFPLLEHLPALASGQPPSCPECVNLEEARQLVGKRPRGIGRLRPSVVLYNEAHRDGEGVGDVVQKDLIGSSKGKGKSGADLLLVVGTSLKVPGTKRMVREFAKAVKSRGTGSSSSLSVKDESGGSAGSTPTLRPSTGGLRTPTPSPRRSPVTATAAEEDSIPVPKAIYLNLDFPVPTREWEGVFDVWMQGDAQQFAEMLQAEVDKEAKAKEVASEKKRKREEEAVVSVKDELPDIGREEEEEVRREERRREKEKEKKQLKPSKKKSGSGDAKGHSQSDSSAKPSKKRRTSIVGPPSPPYTPPNPVRISHSPDNMDEDESDTLALSSSPDSKLYLRIPARSHHRPRHVPEVCITSMSPQRPYEMYARRRSVTPPSVYITSTSRYQHARTNEQSDRYMLSPNRWPHPHAHSSQHAARPTSPCLPEAGPGPEPPSPTSPNKRTKAGRRALREARRADRLAREAQTATRPVQAPVLPPPLAPPPRSYEPLRQHHRESFVRSSAPLHDYHHLHHSHGQQYHNHNHSHNRDHGHYHRFATFRDREQVDVDVDIDVESMDDTLSADILRRTSRLGLCQSS